MKKLRYSEGVMCWGGWPKRIAVCIAFSWLAGIVEGQIRRGPGPRPESNRHFRMAMTAIQAAPGATLPYTNSSAQYTMRDLAPNVDMISLLGEYIGIPFAQFSQSSTPDPADPWTVTASAMALEATTSGKPIMLQLALSRESVVGEALNRNGTLQVLQSWLPPCVDFSLPAMAYLGDAYVNYVTWMSRQFKPAWLVVTVEINAYYDQCGGNTAGWQALAAIERRAYEAARAQLPDAVIFPSFALEPLYNNTLNGWNQDEYQALAGLEKDRFGISTYPEGLTNAAGAFIAPSDLPSDYLTRVRNLNPEEAALVISETGWNSDSIAANYQSSTTQQPSCVNPFLPSSEENTSAYLQFVLDSAERGSFDLVTWWSSRDLIQYTEMGVCLPAAAPPAYIACAGDVWCVQLNEAENNVDGTWGPGWNEFQYKAFGTMGLQRYDGSQKSTLLTQWQKTLALPSPPHRAI
jgi:hypothetical protein